MQPLPHSTRSITEFVGLRPSVEVTLVIDVRTVPRSRTNPQYNLETLPDALRQFEIGYEHIAALGGLRGTTRNVSPSVNAFWQNKTFHNYADYAIGDAFKMAWLGYRAGPRATLRHHVRRSGVVGCHRRIIADYLLAAGETVFHILGAGKIALAQLTSAVRGAGGLTYPAAR